MMFFIILLFLMQKIASATSPSMPPPSSNIINSPLPKHQRQHSWTTFLMHSSNRINPNILSNSFKRDKLQSGSKSGELLRASLQSQFTQPKINILPHHKRGHSLSSLNSKKIQFQNGVKSGELSTVQEKSVKPSKWQSLSRFLGIRTTTTIPKRTVPKCDSKNREKMKEFKFKSNISKEELKLTVKVAIDKGNFAGGKWAKLYNGCFQVNEKWERVAVKLVGRGTIQVQSPSEKKKLDGMSDEEILDDPKNEIENLKKIKEKSNFNAEQIIKLYDGGEILYSNEDDKNKNEYKYAIILELGENNYLDEFIKTFVDKAKIDEKKIMEFLATGIEPFIEIHKVLIHMDFKPQNMIYVIEKSGKNVKKILKVIDFGGAHLFEQSKSNNLESNKGQFQSHIGIGMEGIKLKKVTSTLHIMPPEMDSFHYHNMHPNEVDSKFIPMATTKSDMWEFGMLIYNLLLVREYPEKSDEISRFLENINKIYKFGNEAETFEDIHEFINNMTLYRIKEDDEIPTYIQILKIRSKYPRLFLLITNLLEKDPAKRLSAHGAFYYLKGECRMEIAMNKFIGKITIEMLEKYEYLVDLVKEGEENMKNMINDGWNTMENIPTICSRSYALGEWIADLPAVSLKKAILSESEDNVDGKEMGLWKINHWEIGAH